MGHAFPFRFTWQCLLLSRFSWPRLRARHSRQTMQRASRSDRWGPSRSLRGGHETKRIAAAWAWVAIGQHFVAQK